MRARSWCCAGVLSVLLTLGAAMAAWGQNDAAAQPSAGPAPAPHAVVLLEFDGLRGDAGKDARNLLELGKRGVWAPQGMLPSYPAEDAPNQLAIATGLYPGHHGIVANSFLDPARNARFDATDPQSAADGSWYAGTPLWSLAESHGMRTACLGWLGCAARIAGNKPTYFAGAEGKPEAGERQIVAWLRLPAGVRPQLIAARFCEPGQTERRYGPDAPETRAALRSVDALVGRLEASMKAAGWDANLVVVSDAGMAKPEGGWITLDQYVGLDGFESAGSFLYAKTDAERTHVYNLLKKATSEFFAYRLANLPADLHLRVARVGDPVVIATGAYAIRVHPPAAGAIDRPPPRGLDGFDARTVPAMKAVFFAAGPNIAKGITVAPFENVNLYPWLAHLLGLNPPKNDGNLNILSRTLRDGGNNAGK